MQLMLGRHSAAPRPRRDRNARLLPARVRRPARVGRDNRTQGQGSRIGRVHVPAGQADRLEVK